VTIGISHTTDSIHQESVINAAPSRVYAALTDARQFDGVAALGEAMKTMSLEDNPSVISGEAGGAFALFGGYVTGRQVELVPDTRIVQVWRSAGWKAGEFSLVTWRLTAEGAGTRLTMDHTGFPAGAAEHLAEGCKQNYFEPLAKYFA
jgi:activator of HSP90 ATPase